MTKDAREKLRNMGGIMASYPELMQTAQQFQTGGNVSAGTSPLRFIPDVRRPPTPDLGPRNPGYDPKIFRSGTIDPRLPGTRRVAPVSPDQARKNAILERAASGSPAYGGPFPGSPDMPFEPRVPMGPEAGTPDRAVDRILRDLMAGEISSLEQEEITIDDLLDISISRGIPVNELIDMMPAGVRSKVEASAEKRMGEYLPIPTIGDQPSPIAPRKRPPVIGRGVESLEGPEATGLGGQRIGADGRPVLPRTAEDRLDTTDQERAGRTRASLQEGALEEDLTPEPDQIPAPIRDNPEQVANDALSSLDKSYEEKLALFQKIFGEGKENEAQDRAMSLAMIGLAIAAGQSPNALTNIAQGAITGLKAMGDKDAARRAKSEKTKLLALDAALKEHAAQQEFAQKLGLEALKAGNKAQYRDTPTIRQEGGFGDVEVYLPLAGAAQQGVTAVLADPKSMDKKYQDSLDGRKKVFDMVDRADQLLNEYEIGGFGGALARFKQDFSAAIPSFLKEAVGFDGSTEPTPQQEYDTIMRAMAAQFTPIILGESGRTISDGDRQRVAQILGFAVDNTTGKIGQYTGTAITSESELKSALRQVRSILGSNYSEMDRIYRRYRPEQYRQLQEKQKPSNVRRFDAQGNPIK